MNVGHVASWVGILGAVVAGTWTVSETIHGNNVGELNSRIAEHQAHIDKLETLVNQKHGLSIVPPPPTYTKTSNLSEPDYKGFTFKKDFRIVDLRSRIPLPQKAIEELHEKEISPVTWVRYTLLTKDQEVNHPLDFEFASTKFLFPRCLTHNAEYIKSENPHLHGANVLKDTWHVRVDLTEEPVSEHPFLIINEATYWNSFGGETQEWLSIKANENAKTELMGVIILFPENKPFKHYSLYEYKHGTPKKPVRSPFTLIPGDNNRTLVWKIPNPRTGYAYQIDWTW